MAAGSVWIISRFLKIYSDAPNDGDAAIGTLIIGKVVKELDRKDIEYDGLWIRIDKGWIRIKEYDSKTGSVIKSNALGGSISSVKSDNGSDSIAESPVPVEVQASSNASEFMNISSVAGVFGLPYQFLPSADPRPNLVDSNGNIISSYSDKRAIGYEYAEKIINRIPLLFLTPGRPSFLTEYTDKERESLLTSLLKGTGIGSGGSSMDERLQKLLDNGGRYYTFKHTNAEYYSYVNPLCRAASIYMGIDDIILPGATEKLKKLDWQDYTSSGIKGISDFGTFRSVPFYVDTDTQVSESFSNQTTASQLASTLNSASALANEINFIMGMGSTALDLNAITSADVQSNQENIQDMINRLLPKGGAAGFLERLVSHVSVIATGGKLYFPEIWSDSSFSRTYNCHFKFISPDPSNLGVYLNVIVPLMHLLGLVSPQTVDGNINAYTSPFLVRAIYKGMFSIDTGIITSMNVTKGAECQWTINGIPTSIEVDIEIKDLYNAMAITPTTGDLFMSYDTLNNTALMDYLANLCGINIYKPELARMVEMWYNLNIENKVSDFFKNDIWGNIQDKVQDLIMNIYR